MPLTTRLALTIRRGWRRARWLNRLLYPVAVAYAALMALRRWTYACGLLRQSRMPVPVIVVGNLSVGGTGKTPLVMALVQHLKRRGFTPAVISRGYRSRGTGARAVDAHTTAAEVGDEPLLIARRCRVPVVVGAARVASARLLLSRHRCDLIISDDGFQHHALQRDLDIVVIDGERRLGNGWCLPAGPLREPPRALRRAGLVVVNHGQQPKVGSGESPKASQPTPPEWPMHTRLTHAVRLDLRRARPLRAFAGADIHAIAGIANPARFFRQIEAHGIRVIPHPHPDHHPFTAADLAFATAATTLFMTEKDAVKIAPILPPALAARCWLLPQQVILPPGFTDAVLAHLPAPRRPAKAG